MKPWFSSVEVAQRINIIEAREALLADQYEDKIDLLIGAYRTAEGEPFLMPFVRKIEQKIVNDPNLNHEYLWFLGLDDFNKVAARLILGDKNQALLEGRAFAVQTISGNGALRMGTEFMVRHLNKKTIYLSTPTWDNHHITFSYGGFTDVQYYRYWNPATRGVDITGMLEDLKKAPECSIVALHMAAHNPTGCDLTQEQWAMVADVMQERNLFPFIDAAYQGFASGDLDKDAWPVRYLVGRGFELFIAQSFSKNLGLYSERIGCLTVVLAKGRSQDAINMTSQLKLIARAMYNCPAKHGALIVTAVLSDPTIMAEWKKCLQMMHDRIQSMRDGLKERLLKLGTPGNWDHITSQVGMFSFLGLSRHQVDYIMKKHHVHILCDSRTNMCGLNKKNIDRVAEAVHDAVVNIHN